MSHAHDRPVYCAKRSEGCMSQFPGSRWHQIRAQSEGWFFSQREDAAYCPDHVPGWVANWREKRRTGCPPSQQ